MGTSRCFLVLSVPTGTSRFRMTRWERGPCRSISWVKPWYADDCLFLLLVFADPSSKHGAGADIFTANMYLAEDRVRFSLFVRHDHDSFVVSARSCAGSWYRSEGDRGSCTTSSQRMPLRMYQTKHVLLRHASDQSNLDLQLGARANLSAETLAQRLFLCRRA